MDPGVGRPEGVTGQRSLALPQPFRLNIGGGRERREGWHNFNIKADPGVDFVGDCSDLGFFPDRCCDELYASHVVEHLPYQKLLPAALSEFHRILKPGGSLSVSVPDLDTLSRLFLDPRLSLRERFHVMRMMFGGQMDREDFHYIGFNYPILEVYLRDAGFRAVQRVDFFGLFDDSSTLTPYFGLPISLNVRALK
ncbi:MAG: methyltransferase domain-containing protein [Magnetococcales bacterium]|nr:methyltransferase domain-containing protein [Magnetococcales bacterium]